MRTILSCVLAAALAVAVVPSAEANHGLTARVAATLDNGDTVWIGLGYLTGNYDTQTWSIDVTSASLGTFSCLGFGSIEVGFTGTNCPVAVATGGIDHSHSYPHSEPDIHSISVTVASGSGTGTQVVLPDNVNGSILPI